MVFQTISVTILLQVYVYIYMYIYISDFILWHKDIFSLFIIRPTNILMLVASSDGIRTANYSLKNDCFGRVVLCCFAFLLCCYCCCLAFLSISWSDCSCTILGLGVGV